MRRQGFLSCWVPLVLLAVLRSAGGQVPCETGLDLIFQHAALSGPGHLTGELFANAIDSLEIEAPRGEVPRTVIHAGISSQLPGTGGVQAWSLYARTAGYVRVVTATTEGTAAAEEPDGLLRGGFTRTHAGKMERATDCGESGFITAIVLSFTRPVVLPTRGTATILAVTIEGAGPQGHEPMAGALSWFDPRCSCSYPPVEEEGMGQGGCGQPVASTITVGGSQAFACRHDVTVTFLGADSDPFLRGDANSDGRVDISDAVRTFMYLFLGAPEPTCADTADTNDTGTLDITDGLVILNDFFRPGTGISPPGPFQCGRDPSGDDLGCKVYLPCE